MSLKISSAIILCVVALSVFAQDFDEWDAQNRAAFEEHQKQSEEQFNAYRERIEKLWNEFKESTPTEWVQYGDNDHTRSTVDFEAGKVTISTLVDPDEKHPEEEAKKQLGDQLKTIVEEKDADGEPILDDQIESIDERNVDQVAEEVVESPKVEELTLPDGSKKLKYTVTLDMTPDHLKVRIDRYLPMIREICAKHDIAPSVILAVIQTESTFNPRAYNRSSNACGLMQIVPRFAGRAMNKQLYGVDRKPTRNELFDSRRNIEMGVGYFKHLHDCYFNDVEKLRSRYYCMIAGYNGGAGNVFKAVDGSRGKSAAFTNKVNAMQSDAFFEFLRKNLPPRETRLYLKNVVDRTQSFGGI